MKKEKKKIKKSSIDAFNDSADSNSDEAFIKTRFAVIIRDVMIERGLEGGKAAETLDINKSEADALLKGKFSDFSLGCLLSLLDRLDIYVEFVVHEIPPGEPPKGLRISTSF
ncbi:MAG: XRE family transcriptional regulator [Candidatus Poribacteria bacterium]|nr:XRE family transcriptional regulator [Candidatus Poribacteria bacterium]MYK20494.1 hypothetical protein [Candidatus Poribacteria bacterium]